MEYKPTKREESKRRRQYLRHQWKLKWIPFYRQYNTWRKKRGWTRTSKGL